MPARIPGTDSMVQLAHGRAGSPHRRSGRPWARLLDVVRGARPATSAPAAVVSDEQISAFVAAAESLGRRHRSRCPEPGSPDADERLLRLDWAARAGRLALAERAGRALTPPGALAPEAGQPRRRR